MGDRDLEILPQGNGEKSLPSPLGVPPLGGEPGSERKRSRIISKLFGAVSVKVPPQASPTRKADMFLGLTEGRDLVATFTSNDIEPTQWEAFNGNLSRETTTHHDLSKIGIELIVPYRMELGSISTKRVSTLQAGRHEFLSLKVIPPLRAGERIYEQREYQKDILLSDFLPWFAQNGHSALLEFVPPNEDQSRVCLLIRDPDNQPGKPQLAMAIFFEEKGTDLQRVEDNVLGSWAVAGEAFNNIVRSIQDLRPGEFDLALKAVRGRSDYKKEKRSLIKSIMELQALAKTYEVNERKSLILRLGDAINIRLGKSVSRASAGQLASLKPPEPANKPDKSLPPSPHPKELTEKGAFLLPEEPAEVSALFFEIDKTVPKLEKAPLETLGDYVDKIQAVMDKYTKSHGQNLAVYKAAWQRLKAVRAVTLERYIAKAELAKERETTKKIIILRDRIGSVDEAIRTNALAEIGLPYLINHGGDFTLIREIFQNPTPEAAVALVKMLANSPIFALPPEKGHPAYHEPEILKERWGVMKSVEYIIVKSSHQYDSGFSGYVYKAEGDYEKVRDGSQACENLVNPDLPGNLDSPDGKIYLKDYLEELNKAYRRYGNFPAYYLSSRGGIEKLLHLPIAALEQKAILPGDEISRMRIEIETTFREYFQRRIVTDLERELRQIAQPFASIGDFHYLDEIQKQTVQLGNPSLFAKIASEVYKVGVMTDNEMIKQQTIAYFHQMGNTAFSQMKVVSPGNPDALVAYFMEAEENLLRLKKKSP